MRIRGLYLGLLGALFTAFFSLHADPVPLPEASWQKLPRWRGFNLVDKFYKNNKAGPFHEEDFQLISQWGFNFVRLPMDYRLWIEGDDWTKFKESELKEIDQAVEWGKKYGIHVCINFHRAPGYTVAKPAEKLNVFKDDEALRACALHWTTFARRYKGIPNRQLSFNLFNEPGQNVSEEDYVRVVRYLAEAIRAEDPERLIICDGLKWGTIPAYGLVPLKVAQATRGYVPMEITHYKASWVNSSDYPAPRWPRYSVPSNLYGPIKKDLCSVLPIYGDWKKGDKLRISVNVVSGNVTLSVRMDGQEVWKKEFQPGAGEGEWKQSIYKPEWKIYQNVYDKTYELELGEGKLVELGIVQGDWMTLNRLTIIRDGNEYVLDTSKEWGTKQGTVTFQPTQSRPFSGGKVMDREYLKKECVEPWKKLEGQGVGIIVGEFGVFNKTPHDVALSWMKDCLQNWKEAGWGWALWNFRGSLGVLDSERGDVSYENIQGHKLDRQMLELLQQY